MDDDRPLIGIDFGTATTLVSRRLPDGPAEIVPIGRDTSWIPSVIGIAPDRSVSYGEDALAAPGDVHLLRSIKTCVTNEQDVVRIGDGLTFKVDGLIRGLLETVRKRSHAAGVPWDDASFRVACPAVWDGSRRRRLAEICRSAGVAVAVADIIDEPIAVGLSWVENKWRQTGKRPEGRALVFDYGGGTLDIAVVEVAKGLGAAPPEFTIFSARGSATGGDNLDDTIARDLLAVVGADDVTEPLRTAARRLKELLSDLRFTEQSVPFGGRHSQMHALSYSRSRLDDAFRPQFYDAMEAAYAGLKEVRLRRRDRPSLNEIRAAARAEFADDIDYILLAGGMSRVPLVEALLRYEFPGAVIEVDEDVAQNRTREESVARGLVAQESEYRRLSLPRPAFDLVLEYRDCTRAVVRRTLYPAFTPLYTPASLFTTSSTAFTVHLDDRDLGGVEADGHIKVVAADGERLTMRIDGKPANGLPVALRRHVTFAFKLDVDGTIFIRDCLGAVTNLRVERWPVLRSGIRNVLDLSTGKEPKPDKGWSSFTDSYSHPWE